MSAKSGKLESVTINRVTLQVTQDFFYYSGNGGTINGRVSGAYIFRPSDQNAKTIVTKPSSVKYKKGKLVDEVHQVFNEEVRQIIRVYKDLDNPYIEFDWLVGNLQTYITSILLLSMII